MGLFKKKIVKKTYDREHMKPVIRVSIWVKCIFKFYLARVNSIPVEFTSAWIFPSSFYKILLQMIPCLCRRRIK